MISISNQKLRSNWRRRPNLSTRLQEIQPDHTRPSERVLQQRITLLREQVQIRLRPDRITHLLPEAALIRISLAQALLERGQKEDVEKIITHLNRAQLKEENSPLLWQLMAGAYDRLGKNAFAKCAMAEYYLTLGQEEKAQKMAQKSLKDLPEKSACTIRMLDILKKENLTIHNK